MIRLTELFHRCHIILIDTMEELLMNAMTLLYRHRDKVWHKWDDARTVIDIVSLVR